MNSCVVRLDEQASFVFTDAFCFAYAEHNLIKAGLSPSKKNLLYLLR